MQQWQPNSSLQCMQQRACLLARAREYFQSQNVLEVETPLVSAYTVTEPNIESINFQLEGLDKYLQTSPEYAMKRLLAAGVPDCYQICKAFRLGENGPRHNPEFTLIEWYRRTFNLQQMIEDTLSLLSHLSTNLNVSTVVSYEQAWQDALGVSWAELSDVHLSELASTQGCVNSEQLNTAQLLDFIFSQAVSRHFSSDGLTVIYGYPITQAALAQNNIDQPNTVDRFEVFFQDLELANGYVELTDANELRRRFEKDLVTRAAMGLPLVALDQRLLAAQQAGLPACAGVAVGLDRVLMALNSSQDIGQVLSFDWHQA